VSIFLTHQERHANNYVISLGWSTSPALCNHDETHKKMRRVLASALHPTAARSYGPQHVDTTLDLLREIVSDPTSFMESASAAIGSFTIRLAYGYVPKTRKDPILPMAQESARYAGISLTQHWLVNDFPLCKCIHISLRQKLTISNI
jgi:cytochrome P450